MPRRYLFADESGDLTRRPPQPGVTRYFAVGTLLVDDDELGEVRRSLAKVRDHLAWHSHGLDSYFHASNDSAHVRMVVFDALAPLRFQLDVTLVEKLAAPGFDPASDLYRLSWFHHLKRIGPLTFAQGDEVLIAAAELGVRRERAAFRRGIEDAMRRLMPFQVKRRLAFWPCSSDFGLQAADYCLWAVCRFWERGDDDYRKLITDKIRSEQCLDFAEIREIKHEPPSD